jgi:hypothetical protein
MNRRTGQEVAEDQMGGAGGGGAAGGGGVGGAGLVAPKLTEGCLGEREKPGGGRGDGMAWVTARALCMFTLFFFCKTSAVG